MKKPALIEIDERLMSTGMSKTEVDMLMARFLEEEAKDYVDCMELVDEDFFEKENTIIS